MIIITVSPVVVHRCTKLPRDRFSVQIFHSSRRNDHFRTCESSAVNIRMICYDTSVLLSGTFQTIVNNNIRLMFSDHTDQLFCFPCIFTHVVIREIKPENIQLSVIGHQFFHLAMHIFQIPVKIDIFIFIRLISAHWMVHIIVFRIVRMMPVNQCKVKPYF